MDTNIIDFKKYGKDELIDKLTKIYNELDIMRESEIFKNDDELTFNIDRNCELNMIGPNVYCGAVMDGDIEIL